MNDLVTTQYNGFSINIDSFERGKELASMIAGSDLAPKDYKGKPANCMVAMMLGNELGLNPIQSLQNIAVINGRPSMWGDAMLALCRKHPDFESIKETFDDSTKIATCIVKRKGNDPHTETFSLDDAKEAGLLDKPGPWKQYRKRMQKLRARGFALRDVFGDALLGLISREEAEDMPKEYTPYSVVNDEGSEASVLNSALKKENPKPKQKPKQEERKPDPEPEKEKDAPKKGNEEKENSKKLTYAEIMSQINQAESVKECLSLVSNSNLEHLHDDQRDELREVSSMRQDMITG
jgi:hypothetical protein